MRAHAKYSFLLHICFWNMQTHWIPRPQKHGLDTKNVKIGWVEVAKSVAQFYTYENHAHAQERVFWHAPVSETYTIEFLDPKNMVLDTKNVKIGSLEVARGFAQFYIYENHAHAQ